MPRPRALLLLLALVAALPACSGFTRFHPARPLPEGAGAATVNLFVPVDFSVRVGFAEGWDAGLRFTRPGMGFTEIHADVQRDLFPGRDGATLSVGMGAGVSTAFNEWVFQARGGEALVLQPSLAYGGDRGYGAFRPALLRSPENGAWAVLPILTGGGVLGSHLRFVPEVNVVGDVPSAGLGLQYYGGGIWEP